MMMMMAMVFSSFKKIKKSKTLISFFPFLFDSVVFLYELWMIEAGVIESSMCFVAGPGCIYILLLYLCGHSPIFHFMSLNIL